MAVTVDNVTYQAVPETDSNCTGCAAYDQHPRLRAALQTKESLCVRAGIIWVLAHEKQFPATEPKPADPVTAALKSYDQLATAMQAAGGDIQALGDMTLFEFLVAAAKNNISITAKYSR